MRKKLLLGAALLGATGFALAPAHHHQRASEPAAFRPARTGLTPSPASLLPKTINHLHPVRVAGSTLDPQGRPVVRVRIATDRAAATRLVTDAQHARNAIGVELDGVATVADALTGSDAYRGEQWDLGAMRAPAAWPASTGAGVTVAVVDTGVDAGHPDLAGQVLPGADLVDDTTGPATDPNGHGTHVAGTIAAVAGNGQGIAGIAPDARILPVRVLGANGSGYLSTVANGIVYAADHGADVINLSVSSTTDADMVTNAIAYARSKGVVVVAAAGNLRGSGSPVSYPAADPGVIAVAATDRDDAVASYSNAGGYVAVAAPGSDILSTFPGGYRSMNGTSMAAPHVSALAALIRSADRSLDPAGVERVIESTAVDLGAPGRDDDFGYGRVDAAAALAALAPAPSTPSTPSPEPATPSEEPTSPAPSSPSQEPTSPAPSTPSQEPTSPDPSTPSQEPTSQEATPAPPTAAPTESAPAVDPTPAAQPNRLYVVRTGPTRLVVALIGVDGQQVELQQQTGDDWTTVLTYPAVRGAHLDGLTPGTTYRVVVPGPASWSGVVSNPVRL